jgi:hypothetical protein
MVDEERQPNDEHEERVNSALEAFTKMEGGPEDPEKINALVDYHKVLEGVANERFVGGLERTVWYNRQIVQGYVAAEWWDGVVSSVDDVLGEGDSLSDGIVGLDENEIEWFRLRKEEAESELGE